MWCPPAWNRNVQQEFLDKRIGGALRFDMAEFTDKSSPTPLMILPQQLFEEKVGKVGYYIIYYIIYRTIMGAYLLCNTN